MAPRHQFRGKVTRRARSKKGFSQASTRRPSVARDQHGREWWMSLDNKNGRPVGMINPSFQAPWTPDQQHLLLNPDNASELFIDYEAMLRPRRVRAEEYHVNAVRFARDNKLKAPERGNYAPEITDNLGKPPRPVEPVIAAMQENPWIIGATTVPDPRLERFIETNAFDDGVEEFDFGPRSFDEARARNASAKPDPLAEDAPIGNGAADASENGSGMDGLDEFDGGDADDLLEALEEIEEAADPAALGGKRVDPRKSSVVAKQAPRRPGQAARKKARGNRPTLADGAAPVVGD